MNIKNKIISDFEGNGEMILIPCSKKYCNNQEVHVCKYSGLVRVKNLRSSDEIVSDWSNLFFENKKKKVEPYTANIPAVVARQSYVAEFINNYFDISKKNICDLGTGEGNFLKLIKNMYGTRQLFGVEHSKNNCKLLTNSNIKNFNGSVEQFQLSQVFDKYKNKFDVVSIMWTLVNSYSPLNFIKIAKELLNTNGVLVVAESSRILVPFKKPLNYYFSKNPVDLHPYHFSNNSLQNLLKVCGFKVEKVNRFIDTDLICIIAKKTNKSQNYKLDDYKKVLSFFKRWDKETQYYL